MDALPPTLSPSCATSYLHYSEATTSPLTAIPSTFQISFAINDNYLNFSSTNNGSTSLPPLSQSTATPPPLPPPSWQHQWISLSSLLNTNLLTLLLLPLVIREIPTIMTTTLDPLLDYVFDPWSWGYFPVWCAEVWRLLRDERQAVVAGLAGSNAGVGAVERVWVEKGVVEVVELRIGKV
ncbi:uncharacterized protein BKCO1_2400032 [Diplodia corticola]|uniref:Uncharacterized protein n=1 Tax=Diplodia corticola TaxID=236234 RepID=A0A1J9S0V3_9PEZI|nr:uncharacterized protein BKCO1_2400032 [Diplodia corticola]OJD34215.1 hypothetical protein BKCO1_2400032 [Diplodia corticola]